MNKHNLETRLFDYLKASTKEFEAVNLFENSIRHERWPEDPLKTVEETVKRWQSVPPFISLSAWGVWHDEALVAMAHGNVFENVDHNQHVLFFELDVLPAWRRQGIGKLLFNRLVSLAREKNRTLMGSQTNSAVPDGEQFAERIGAELGLAMKINQLDLKDLDWDLMRQWQEAAQERAKDYEVGLWHGPYPEDELTQIAEMKAFMNTAPRDDLDVEDFKFTPEHLKQVDDHLAKRGVERWTMYARNLENNELAGYTEVFWEAGQPETLQQGDTAVVPKYRKNGLGRWLKAAMIEEVVAQKPQLKRVRTGNANSNAPMLKINQEMGFYEYKVQKVWQISVEKAEAYCRGSR